MTLKRFVHGFSCTAVPALAVLLILPANQAWADTLTIDFDDHAALTCPCIQGFSVPLADIVNIDYQSLGVVFSSGGDGIAILAGSDPVSPPNTASGTDAGDLIDYNANVSATFSGVVSSVSITLTNTSTSATLSAFDALGDFLSSASGSTGNTLVVTDPGLIHSVTLSPRNAAFDNFTFSSSVPEPGSLSLILSGGLVGLWLRKRRRSGSFLKL